MPYSEDMYKISKIISVGLQIPSLVLSCNITIVQVFFLLFVICALVQSQFVLQLTSIKVGMCSEAFVSSLNKLTVVVLISGQLFSGINP